MLLQELVTKLGFEVDENPLEHLNHRIEKIHGLMKAFAAVEIVKGLYELSERFANLGEQLESTAIAAGVSTDALQELQFAASQNAVGPEALTTAMTRLNRTLAAARGGSQQAQKIFAKLGITPDQINSFETGQDALYAIQDAMKGMTSASQKQAITLELFGRGAGNMVKFLSLGSEATKQLGSDAEKMGAVISGQTVRDLAEFEDAATGLGMVVRSLLATVGGALAPAFREVIHMIERSWAENIDAIRANIRSFAIKSAFYLGFIAETVRILVKLIAGLVRENSGLVLSVAKWGPAAIAAAGALELFLEGLEKVVGGWRKVTKYAPRGWRALLRGIKKLQAGTISALEGMAQFLGLFTPGLAVRIRAVGLALAKMTPLQFAAVALAVSGLVAAVHDLYQYFVNDVPLENLWLYRLFRWLDPVTSRVSGAMQTIGDLAKSFWKGADWKEAIRQQAVDPELRAHAATHKGPMSMVASLPYAVSATNASMGKRFDPNADYRNPASGYSVMNAPVNVTVNVPPNTSVEGATRIVRDGVTGSIQDMLNMTQRDVQPAAAR